MNDALAGWVGGLVGSALGIAGAILGTWCSIHNTTSAAERRYVIRWAAVFWIGCTAFLVLLFLLPEPYRWLIWLPYGVALWWAIQHCNRGQAAIRSSQNPGTP